MLWAFKTRPRQRVWKSVQASACPKCSPALVSKCVGRSVARNGYAIARSSMKSWALSNEERFQHLKPPTTDQGYAPEYVEMKQDDGIPTEISVA